MKKHLVDSNICFIFVQTKQTEIMTPQRIITYKNPFFQKNNPYSREIHTYSESDYIEQYNGYSIWRHGFSQFDIVRDNVIVSMCAGLDGARRRIDELNKN